MGIDRNAAQALLWAKRQGVDFTITAMIGRQSLYLKDWDLQELFRKNKAVAPPFEVIPQIMQGRGGFAEAFFQQLGATAIDSFDASSYEDASQIWDMNQSLPAIFKNKYTLVFDGGTLEHIFNLPMALKNCLEMVVVGGHFMSIVPANNFMGHGFYQFSPELFYSTLNSNNGYKLIKMALFEDRRYAPWFEVNDPKVVHSRVTLSNHHPTQLMVLARREKAVEVFAVAPQQSDYLENWTGGMTAATGVGAKRNSAVWKRWIPTVLKCKIRRGLTHIQKLIRGPYDRRFFIPWQD